MTMLSISKEEERLQKSMLNIMYGTLYTAQKPNVHVIVVHVSQVPTSPVTYNVHPIAMTTVELNVVHANCQFRFDSFDSFDKSTSCTVAMELSCTDTIYYYCIFGGVQNVCSSFQPLLPGN